jgi:hypothetical protein
MQAAKNIAVSPFAWSFMDGDYISSGGVEKEKLK